jgi:hypothetical protein
MWTNITSGMGELVSTSRMWRTDYRGWSLTCPQPIMFTAIERRNLHLSIVSLYLHCPISDYLSQGLQLRFGRIAKQHNRFLQSHKRCHQVTMRGLRHYYRSTSGRGWSKGDCAAGPPKPAKPLWKKFCRKFQFNYVITGTCLPIQVKNLLWIWNRGRWGFDRGLYGRGRPFRSMKRYHFDPWEYSARDGPFHTRM